jgi:hypothetical protein
MGYCTREEAHKLIREVIELLKHVPAFDFFRNEHGQLTACFGTKNYKEAYEALSPRAVKEYFDYFKRIAEAAGLGIKERICNAEIAEEGNDVSSEDERIREQPDEKFVNVLRDNNTQNSLTGFYNEIADMARTEYSTGGLQCVKFVYNVIRDKLENGEAIAKRIFPSGPLQANDLFIEFENNRQNLLRMPVTKTEELKSVQDEADTGALILAVFENKEIKSSDGKYHGHMAFVGCLDLVMGTNPVFPYENYEGLSGENLEDFERLILVQAGAYCGIAPIRVGTNNWRIGKVRQSLLENEKIRFFKVRK